MGFFLSLMKRLLALVRIHSGPSPAIVLHRPVITDETAARAVNTTYTSGGRPILVIVSITCTKTAAADRAYATGLIGPGTPPVGAMQRSGFIELGGSASQKAHFALIFVVTANTNYRVDSSVVGGGTVVLLSWVEVTL